jgi:hypothetical protein
MGMRVRARAHLVDHLLLLDERGVRLGLHRLLLLHLRIERRPHALTVL